MKQDKYLSWHYYPLYLTREEIMNPMQVVAALFSADWLPGHLTALKKWRSAVIGFYYYKGNKGNPASLLYNYELNIRLVEGIFLIWNNRSLYKDLILPEDQAEATIDLELREWKDYPMLLSQKELRNPFKFIKKFCSCYSLPEYRFQLNEWLSYGLSVRGCGEFMETIDLITVYENLQKLYEACWLIHQRYNSPVGIPQLVTAHEEAKS